MSTKSNLKLHVSIGNKTFPISCGSGQQRIRWLGSVAISRYDDQNFEGWRELGSVARVEDSEGRERDLGNLVKDVFAEGDEVRVYSTTGEGMVGLKK